MNSQRGQVSTFAIAMLMSVLVIGVGLSVATCYATEPEDLPWSNETDVIIIPAPSNETDVIIIPAPPLPPFFSDFNITPTEIMLGDYLIISFVIENTNNHSITWMSANRIGDITQIIEIELENYESKIIWYRIIPHAAGEYDVWIDGMTGTFRVISTEIIVTDPLGELSAEIDRIDAELVSLRDEITQAFNILDGVIAELIVGGDEMDSRIGVLETYSTEVNEQIEYLENKISSLQTIILFAYIAIAVTVICGFYFIKRMN